MGEGYDLKTVGDVPFVANSNRNRMIAMASRNNSREHGQKKCPLNFRWLNKSFVFNKKKLK